ncbi:MAG: SHOCT domain-containing protein, partial [Planctomycetota bacterium]
MMLVVFVIVATIAFNVVRRHRDGSCCGRSPKTTDPMQILRERLARGEITKEEFDAIAAKLDARDDSGRSR